MDEKRPDQVRKPGNIKQPYIFNKRIIPEAHRNGKQHIRKKTN